jgi:hypothetical protein
MGQDSCPFLAAAALTVSCERDHHNCGELAVSAREANTSAEPDLNELIDDGLAAAGILPTYEHVVQLDKQLRVEIERLLPVVQAQADRLNRGTTDWFSQQRVIDEARRTLQDGLGQGLRSAALQVHELARQCGALAGFAVSAGDDG